MELFFVTTYFKLEITIITEHSQAKKDKHLMISYVTSLKSLSHRM